ncbi:GGDEF domain-containing protein [Lysobacter humi (ex Lee et al. 2017)]
MRSIDMLSSFIIGGAGAFIGVGMMLVARQAEPTQRAPLNACLAGFVVLGLGLAQNGANDDVSRWRILFGAMTALVGTLLLARGLTALMRGRPSRGTGPVPVLLLAGTLAAAWTQPHYIFGLAFHALSLLVAAGLAWSGREALLAPRSAAERAVAVTLAVYALTWVYGLWTAAVYRGPELRHLMYMPEPWLSVYAMTYALMPLMVGALVLNLANAQLGARLRRQASTDELTGLLSRRALHERAARWQAGVLEAGRAPCVALVDVDHFKRINDTYGHEAGDAVLRGLARRMRREQRAGDRVARYGGEEFLLLLDAASIAEAAAAAERLRAAVADAPFEAGDRALPVTASLGLAAWPADTDFARAVGRADAALYAAKRGGRDRVVVDEAAAATRRAGDPLSGPAAAGPGTPSPSAARSSN